ncbi:unnamed protein product [Schistosoma margrebowiei]|uniref:Uncharacterized protein n=1 Tax=Schistosoma margrebowiei TaxID=48269 RepID=A0A183MTI0_9TREM|nr:unnamed protein product [Schistosoma margrebowiei]
MESFCPECLRSGFSVPLLKVKSSAGSINGICSSNKCSYPFSVYSDLQLSHDRLSEESQTVRGFLDELFGMDVKNGDGGSSFKGDDSSHLYSDCVPTSSSSGSFDLMQQDVCDSSPVDNLFQNNYMLPRYLADDMKRIISEDLSYSKRSQFQTTSNPHMLEKFNRSSDSGISISSRSSKPSTLSYSEHVAQRMSNQSDAISTSKSVSISSFPLDKTKNMAHFDRLVKLQEERMQLH